MSFCHNFFLVLLSLLQTASAAPVPETTIRVLIDEIKTPKKLELHISSPGGYLLSNPQKPNQQIKYPSHNATIESKGGTLWFIDTHHKRKKLGLSQVVCTPTEGVITVNNKEYEGSITIIADQTKKSILVINSLPLEDYVYAVLLYESYSHWPTEMQKVQAITTRTFAAHQMQIARTRKLPYDIKNNIFHQRYDGTHRYTHLRAAVDETQHQILTHGNDIVLAMFDACCGGAIPADMTVIDFDKAPYLKRNKPCTFCSQFSLYRWKHSCTLNDLYIKLSSHQELKKKITACGPLKAVKIAAQDAGGVVHHLKLVGTNKSVKLPTHKVKNCLGSALKSKLFSLRQRQHRLEFNGKGFGHALGLCQHGAREMIRKQWNFKQVLSFYFPQTKISRLTRHMRIA